MASRGNTPKMPPFNLIEVSPSLRCLGVGLLLGPLDLRFISFFLDYRIG